MYSDSDGSSNFSARSSSSSSQRGSSSSSSANSTISSHSRSQRDSSRANSRISSHSNNSGISSDGASWYLKSSNYHPIELAKMKLDSYMFPVHGQVLNCIPPWRGSPELVYGRVPPREEARSSGFRLSSNPNWEDTGSASSANSAASFQNKVREAPTFHHFMKTNNCPTTVPRRSKPQSEPTIRKPLSSSSETDLEYSQVLENLSSLSLEGVQKRQ